MKSIVDDYQECSRLMFRVNLHKTWCTMIELNHDWDKFGAFSMNVRPNIFAFDD